MMEHAMYECAGNHNGPDTCMVCDGGLSSCTVCKAFEGAWPDDCPGRPMSSTTADEVYAGNINYRDGAWHQECCQAMRHIHDTDNFMAEAGYVRDGVNRAGLPRWVKK